MSLSTSCWLFLLRCFLFLGASICLSLAYSSLMPEDLFLLLVGNRLFPGLCCYLNFCFSREDESQPGARGAWSFSELNSLALLIWSLTCSSLTFCLSSHLLRSQSLFLFSFFLAFSSFLRPLGFVPGPI